jgi:hypothetical protein
MKVNSEDSDVVAETVDVHRRPVNMRHENVDDERLFLVIINA